MKTKEEILLPYHQTKDIDGNVTTGEAVWTEHALIAMDEYASEITDEIIRLIQLRRDFTSSPYARFSFDEAINIINVVTKHNNQPI